MLAAKVLMRSCELARNLCCPYTQSRDDHKEGKVYGSRRTLNMSLYRHPKAMGRTHRITLLREDISEPIFYGDIVHILKEIRGKLTFQYEVKM